MWIEPKISIGNLLTLGILLAGMLIGYTNLQNEVQHNSKRISALSAADTRRSNQISTDIVGAIEALKREVAVMSEAFKRSESTYEDELRRLRDEIGRVRYGYSLKSDPSSACPYS